MLEIGKTYSFKTLTFYYIGTVRQMYPTHAVIDNAVEVYETGPNASYYAGTVKNYERIPDGTLVPVVGNVLIMPYERVLVA